MNLRVVLTSDKKERRLDKPRRFKNVPKVQNKVPYLFEYIWWLVKKKWTISTHLSGFSRKISNKSCFIKKMANKNASSVHFWMSKVLTESLPPSRSFFNELLPSSITDSFLKLSFELKHMKTCVIYLWFHNFFNLFLQKIGVFIGFSWFGSVAMYCGLIIPEKSYEFNSNGVRVSN